MAKLVVEQAIDASEKFLIQNVVTGKSVELCGCCSKMTMSVLMNGTESVPLSLAVDLRQEKAFDIGVGVSKSPDHSEEFLPVEADVPNVENNDFSSKTILYAVTADNEHFHFGQNREETITLNDVHEQQKQSDEVIDSGYRDEEAKRQFGITSRIEIPVSLQKFNKLIDKLSEQQEKPPYDDSIDQLERQLRLGKRLLSQFNRKKTPKLADEHGEEHKEGEEDEQQLNSSEENNDDELDNDQPQTSTANAKKQRGTKRRHMPSRVAKKRLSSKTNANREKKQDGGEWLSKESASRRVSSADQIEESRKTTDHLRDSENDSESTGGSEDIPPPPKMTRAQHQKNLEIKKLFRQANRAMIEDDDEEEDEENGQSDRKSIKSESDGEKKATGRQLKRRESLNSSSSEIVLDSEEDGIKTSEGYEVLTLDDRPFGNRRSATNKKKPKKAKKTPAKKPRPTRKNRHLASDEDRNGESDMENDSGNLDEVVPSSDEEVPKTSSSKKVIAKKDLATETKEAERAEKERRKRLEERQKQFNGIELVTSQSSDSTTTTLVYKGEGSQPALKAIVLDPDSGNDSPDPVRVHPSLVRVLKKHQAEGIKFLYNCTIESLSRLNEPGGGAILGHCMGLGKTLQIIAFLHTLLSHTRISENIHKVLVFAPKNVLLNWINEFDKWLFDNDPELDGVLTYSEIDSLTDNSDRLLAIKRWAKSKKPSVLVIGYDMFRRLTGSDEDRNVPKRGGKVRPQKPKNKSKTEKELDRLKPQFRALLFEAPHMIICDEGHKLKNYESAISKTINRIVARRRVCLTGTPLQNNLSEYYCMVNFVKPNLLGNIKEFKNRFEHIINRGRTADASREDVVFMKRRCHVLHDRLRGILDRRDYTVLKESLPPKQEYVLMIRLTQSQIELYRHFLGFAERNNTLNSHYILQNHVILYRIWTHPYLIIEHEREEERKQLMADDDDFVVHDDEDNGEEEDEEEEENEEDDEVTELDASGMPSTSSAKLTPIRRSRRQNGESADERTETPIELKEWAKNHVTEDDRNRFELGNKLILLMEIIKKCEAIGDKLLVFSQFLNSIALIRRMLAFYADNGKWFVDGHDALMRRGERWSWKMRHDYDVIEGSVSSKDRDRIQREFNDPLNLRKRLLLISTRAGSLGINLVGANRVIIFDCCWNPSHDTQSLFRVYRFGQEKPVYIYRFVAQGTMEERIYNRQVTKESTARRVTEAAQIQRHYKVEDLELMYRFEPELLVDDADAHGPHLDPPKDRLLGDIILSGTNAITSYHTHDLLLTSIEEEQLTSEEREEAWKEYESERLPRQFLPLPMPSPLAMDGTAAVPGTSQQPPFGTATDMAHFSNALQLRTLQLLQLQKQQQVAEVAKNLSFLVQQQQTVRSGEIGYFTQVMGQLTVAYNNDPIYKLCFQVPGMQAKTAYRIFQIKQFLSYFINLIPAEDLGEMNSANAFANYFNGILQNAIKGKQSQESVEEKAMITLATTIEIARSHQRCQAGILFIQQTFPETFVVKRKEMDKERALGFMALLLGRLNGTLCPPQTLPKSDFLVEGMELAEKNAFIQS
ncbi:hypothetical protein niasHT_035477 [Heterodera trifolii]|uniref:Transcriptional regulator ATRX n=1 Tax=Heterodera trifolii TaxID=157864 RepID=A0ABD2I267_9BILA